MSFVIASGKCDRPLVGNARLIEIVVVLFLCYIGNIISQEVDSRCSVDLRSPAIVRRLQGCRLAGGFYTQLTHAELILIIAVIDYLVGGDVIVDLDSYPFIPGT